MARRPSRPSSQNSVALQIEGLPCITEVDAMLVEGAKASDIAAFIQDDQGLLQDVNAKTLANALLARRRLKKEMAEEYEEDHWASTEGQASGGSEIVWRRSPQLPSTLAKMAYERTKGGIEEINELEGLYLAQRDRIDRLMDLEHRAGIFSENTAKEISVAGDLLMKRLTARKELGLIGRQAGDLHLHLDVDVYSENTIKVLQDPEKRHRIVSLLERLGQLKALPIDVDPAA